MYAVFKEHYGTFVPSGDNEIRTRDPLLARQVLSQLSYTPVVFMGLNGLEPSTSRLSGVRSNQLSYKPSLFFFFNLAATYSPVPSPVKYHRPSGS